MLYVVAKTNTLIVTAHLICAFVFSYAKCRVSHVESLSLIKAAFLIKFDYNFKEMVKDPLILLTEHPGISFNQTEATVHHNAHLSDDKEWLLVLLILGY